MVNKLAVVAIGGNSLIKDPQHPEIEHQWAAARETCTHIAQMIADGWQVVLTHGNGPQVGDALRRVELAALHEGLYDLPLDLIVADTQGGIGYMLQQALDNSLRRMGINRTILTVVTQVLVDANDPGFQNPTKPIGSFLTPEQAASYTKSGWTVREDAGRGYRRVVASPQPLAIQEINAIKALMLNNYIVITVGGGGIPVVRTPQGSLRGALAVIDKDRASSLLAQALRADLLIISTAVEQVAINFNTPQQIDLDRLTLAEAEQYLQQGHFAEGSMRPKIEAALAFIRQGGPKAVITSPANLAHALRGQAGTVIVPD